MFKNKSFKDLSMMVLSDSKGISPLIASVLLIAFTMAVAGLFSSWAPELLQGIQSDTSEDTESLLEATNAGLSIESAVFDSSSGNTSVVFRNTGQTELSNFTVTARLSDGGFVQKRVDESLESAGIVSVELNTSSSPDLVRVDSESLDVSAETESISGASGDGSDDGDGENTGSSVNAPSVGGSWSHVEPAGAEGGYDYFFDSSTTPYGATYGGNSSVQYSSDGFFVMKYQASNDGSDVPVSNGDAGWNSISFNDDGAQSGPSAYTACESLDSQTSGFDVHLVTNREWMTIARQVAQDSSNWADGSVGSTGGSGGLYQGNADHGDDGYDRAVDLSSSDYPSGVDYPNAAGVGNATSEMVRTHNLSSGDQVWDLAGDLRMWVDAEEDGTALSNPNSSKIYEKHNRSDQVEGGDGLGDSTGTFDNDRAAFRGGDWYDGGDAGVFSAISFTPGSSGTYNGFRCSAVPVS